MGITGLHLQGGPWDLVAVLIMLVAILFTGVRSVRYQVAFWLLLMGMCTGLAATGCVFFVWGSSKIPFGIGNDGLKISDRSPGPPRGEGRDSGSRLLAPCESLAKWYSFAEASLAHQLEMVLNSPFIPTIMHRSFVRYDLGMEDTYLRRPHNRLWGFREVATLMDEDVVKKLFRSLRRFSASSGRLRIGV